MREILETKNNLWTNEYFLSDWILAIFEAQKICKCKI